MKISKPFWIALGFIALALGAIGVPLPLLPTTPFLLLAAFCFAKGSERLNHWFKSTRLYKNHLESFAVITDVDVAVKKGREILYDARVKAVVYPLTEQINAVISNIEYKEDIPQKEYGMEVVFAKKGQTAWDIAKQNYVKEELVKAQNQDTTFPLEEDTAIVLFYQNTKNAKLS